MHKEIVVSPIIIFRFITYITLTLFVTIAYASPTQCLNNANNNARLDDCIKLDNLVSHLQAFQQHADQNQELPGTRFTATAGLEASRDYIVSKLRQAGYNVSLQDVPINVSYVTKPSLMEQVSPVPRLYTDNVDYTPFVSSGAGDITAAVQTPPGNVSGCNASDYAGFNSNNLVLIERGTCSTAVKLKYAVNAGAKAIIMYNNTAGILSVAAGSPVPSETTPIVFVTPEVGKELKAAMQQGKLPVLHINFHTVSKSGYSQNIIAESAAGDSSQVIMAGAHLDSSAVSSGMNDNGSGSAAILEAALQIQSKKIKNKVRFAWWTGEELGLLGSNYYMAHLSNNEKQRIKVYLNYEILGAPNGGRMIMDAVDGVTPLGTAKITRLYENYFKSMGLKSYSFDPRLGDAGIRSDMFAFMQAGIPVGYLVTGADLPWNEFFDRIFTDLPKRVIGMPSHPCYHQVCDKLTLKSDSNIYDDNFDFALYLQMSKAAAYAIEKLAMDGN